MRAHRFDWRTHGRVTAQWCCDCGMPGVVDEPGECPGPPDEVSPDYLAPAQRGTRVEYRNGKPVIVMPSPAPLE